MNGKFGSDGNEANVLREIEERVRARLSTVERQNERLQTRTRLLGLGLLVAGAILAVVAVAPDTLTVVGLRQGESLVEAHGFRLVDSNGIRRGEWWVDDDGAARLSLLDQQGRPRLNVTVLQSGSPGISLMDNSGMRRAVIGVLPDGETNIVLADVNETPRVVLGLNTQNTASLAFADADATTRLGLGLDASGMGSLMLPDSTAQPADSVAGDGRF